jgi:hypothetical protein
MIELLSMVIAIAMLLLGSEPECKEFLPASAASWLQHLLPRSYHTKECTSHGQYNTAT